MTRAFISLLKGEIQIAFYYHPLFPIVIIVLLYLLLFRKKHKLSANTELLFFIVVYFLFIAVYIYRYKHNILP